MREDVPVDVEDGHERPLNRVHGASDAVIFAVVGDEVVHYVREGSLFDENSVSVSNVKGDVKRNRECGQMTYRTNPF